MEAPMIYKTADMVWRPGQGALTDQEYDQAHAAARKAMDDDLRTKVKDVYRAAGRGLSYGTNWVAQTTGSALEGLARLPYKGGRWLINKFAPSSYASEFSDASKEQEDTAASPFVWLQRKANKANSMIRDSHPYETPGFEQTWAHHLPYFASAAVPIGEAMLGSLSDKTGLKKLYTPVSPNTFANTLGRLGNPTMQSYFNWLAGRSRGATAVNIASSLAARGIPIADYATGLLHKNTTDGPFVGTLKSVGSWLPWAGAVINPSAIANPLLKNAPGIGDHIYKGIGRGTAAVAPEFIPADTNAALETQKAIERNLPEKAEVDKAVQAFSDWWKEPTDYRALYNKTIEPLIPPNARQTIAHELGDNDINSATSQRLAHALFADVPSNRYLRWARLQKSTPSPAAVIRQRLFPGHKMPWTAAFDGAKDLAYEDPSMQKALFGVGENAFKPETAGLQMGAAIGEKLVTPERLDAIKKNVDDAVWTAKVMDAFRKGEITYQQALEKLNKTIDDQINKVPDKYRPAVKTTVQYAKNPLVQRLIWEIVRNVENSQNNQVSPGTR